MSDHWRCEYSKDKQYFNKHPSAPCNRWCSCQEAPDRCLSFGCDELFSVNPVALAEWITKLSDKDSVNARHAKKIARALLSLNKKLLDKS